MAETGFFNNLINAGKWMEILDLVTVDSSPEASRAAYRACVELGYQERAEEWLGRILEKFPQDVTMLRNKGTLHFKRGEIDEA